jgi:hypothetical protein
MRSTIDSLGTLIVAAIMVCAVGLVVSGCRGTKPSPEAKAQEYIHKMREAVSRNVAEKDRRDRMLAIVDQMEALERGFNDNVAVFVQKYRGLNGNYDAPRNEFDKLFEGFDADIKKARDRYFDLHFQLSALSTAEEWNGIVKYEEDALKEATKPRVQKEGAK